MERQDPRLCAESEQRKDERDAGPRRAQMAGAQCRERVVALAPVQHAEAEQDPERADMRDQQIEEAGAADRGDPVVAVTRKYDDSAIVSHATMNSTHRRRARCRHRARNDVIQDAVDAGRRAFAVAK
jgi:hypothetical protein